MHYRENIMQDSTYFNAQRMKCARNAIDHMVFCDGVADAEQAALMLEARDAQLVADIAAVLLADRAASRSGR